MNEFKVSRSDLIFLSLSLPPFLSAPLASLWSRQASRLREQRLKESVAFHQFQTDASDMEAWLQEALRQVTHSLGDMSRRFIRVFQWHDQQECLYQC